MSPRYDFDPSKATASIEIFPKDDYEFIIGEPKSFIRKNKKGEDSFGVRYSLTHAGGQFANKRTVYSLYLHSEGGQAFAKQFQMSAMGFRKSPAAEQEFNSAIEGINWSYDPEVGACGEGWHKLAGARIIGVLDVGPNPENPDEQQQQFKGWRPITA